MSVSNWGDTTRATGDAIFKRNSEAVRTSLKKFLNDGIVDGAKLSAHWFPIVKADVFISHSHQNEADAIKCASWLKDNFGLESFIDSCVWGHADELLKIIDKEYCLNQGGETYDYDKRNGSTSHVHMMLACAISAMLEATECVFFINTPNSITSSQAVAKTQSPWLFFELSTMRVIRRRKRDGLIAEVSFANKKAALKIDHEVALKELTPLGVAQLNAWIKAIEEPSKKFAHKLDLLYDIAPETE